MLQAFGNPIAIPERTEADFYENIGRRIRFHRKRQNLTGKQLGDKLNVNLQRIHKWETGENRIPVYELKKLANALNISLDTLVI